MNPVATILPVGYSTDGRYWREAYVRPLTGEDHLFLTEECAGLLPAQWVTEALTRCITRLGPEEPVSREAVRSLTIGDREALLLHLRRLSLGNRLRCLLTCPSPDCQEKLEIDANIARLFLPPYGGTAQEHELTFTQGEGAPTVVRFWLPSWSRSGGCGRVKHAPIWLRPQNFCSGNASGRQPHPMEPLLRRFRKRSVSTCRIGWPSWTHRPRPRCILLACYAVPRSARSSTQLIT